MSESAANRAAVIESRIAGEADANKLSAKADKTEATVSTLVNIIAILATLIILAFLVFIPYVRRAEKELAKAQAVKLPYRRERGVEGNSVGFAFNGKYWLPAQQIDGVVFIVSSNAIVAIRNDNREEQYLFQLDEWVRQY
jgi:hypothetical protein